ncbi:MAG: hypothetical protein HYZ53_26530 [Planctomycetes bacterium]|nr:hypothetical protein [Planctomycetota bacterium]
MKPNSDLFPESARFLVAMRDEETGGPLGASENFSALPADGPGAVRLDQRAERAAGLARAGRDLGSADPAAVKEWKA